MSLHLDPVALIPSQISKLKQKYGKNRTAESAKQAKKAWV